MAYEATEVAVEKSQAEIRKLLYGHGAVNFSFGEARHAGQPWALVEFVHQDQAVRVQVAHKPVNTRLLREKVNRSRSRSEDQIRRDLEEQEARRIWRVLFHGLKARLVSVEEGVETFEEAFLAHLVDPVTGRTIWEQAKHLVESGALKIGGPGVSVGQPALGAGSLRVVEDPADDDVGRPRADTFTSPVGWSSRPVATTRERRATCPTRSRDATAGYCWRPTSSRSNRSPTKRRPSGASRSAPRTSTTRRDSRSSSGASTASAGGQTSERDRPAWSGTASHGREVAPPPPRRAGERLRHRRPQPRRLVDVQEARLAAPRRASTSGL
ncbi:MAG: hypothetical protein ACRD0H_26610, partial [Actinomycetes bacterium]